METIHSPQVRRVGHAAGAPIRLPNPVVQLSHMRHERGFGEVQNRFLVRLVRSVVWLGQSTQRRGTEEGASYDDLPVVWFPIKQDRARRVADVS